jgi:hypothetical protein
MHFSLNFGMIDQNMSAFAQGLLGQRKALCLAEKGCWQIKNTRGRSTQKGKEFFAPPRAEKGSTVNPEYRIQPDYAKSEDPAKMTYSIPDFVSRNTTQNQEFFPVLESTSPRSKIKT